MELDEVLLIAQVVSGVLLIATILLMLRNRDPENDRFGTRFFPAFTLHYILDARMLNQRGKVYRKAIIVIFSLFVLVGIQRILMFFM
jgi:hypothetical protein